ncbi:hypothetical protein DCCM_4420 [Desulfocucumis palustris]|uniref:Uncharacterized protein n=1 Tax=Desulfocucumis palustris TaxID=1898651 RepID=A0A2L2XG27_9FIRM|nr:hypothetical protein DCCM_4420 [Desulfocucumis palustris]
MKLLRIILSHRKLCNMPRDGEAAFNPNARGHYKDAPAHLADSSPLSRNST